MSLNHIGPILERANNLEHITHMLWHMRLKVKALPSSTRGRRRLGAFRAGLGGGEVMLQLIDSAEHGRHVARAPVDAGRVTVGRMQLRKYSPPFQPST